MLSRLRNRKIAAILAFAGALSPIAGLHKFYLGQYRWGILYVLLSIGHIPIATIAGVIEGIWYLSQDVDEFNYNFNQNRLDRFPSPATPSVAEETIDPKQVGAIAEALRQLDQLRQEGLISEYEFEQKRRQLLDQIS